MQEKGQGYKKGKSYSLAFEFGEYLESESVLYNLEIFSNVSKKIRKADDSVVVQVGIMNDTVDISDLYDTEFIEYQYPNNQGATYVGMITAEQAENYSIFINETEVPVRLKFFE